MITLDQAKAHCRVDNNDDDADIALKLSLANQIIEDYIGSYIGSSNSPIVDAAVLLVVGELYANREASANPLSPTVRLILERARVPGFA